MKSRGSKLSSFNNICSILIDSSREGLVVYRDSELKTKRSSLDLLYSYSLLEAIERFELYNLYRYEVMGESGYLLSRDSLTWPPNQSYREWVRNKGKMESLQFRVSKILEEFIS